MRANDHGTGGNLQSVLFVCTGNIFRSVTAEYALKARLGSDMSHVISSAGIDVKPQSMHAWVQARLREKGADLTTHIPRRLTWSKVPTSSLQWGETTSSSFENNLGATFLCLIRSVSVTISRLCSVIDIIWATAPALLSRLR